MCSMCQVLSLQHKLITWFIYVHKAKIKISWKIIIKLNELQYVNPLTFYLVYRSSENDSY